MLLGFDIGGTKCGVVIGSETDILRAKKIPTDHTISPQDMILRLCMVYLKNHSDAEDIFQTVF